MASIFDTIQFENLIPLLDLGVDFFNITTQGYGYKIDEIFFFPVYILGIEKIQYYFKFPNKTKLTINIMEDDLETFIAEMRYLGYAM